MHQIFKHTVTVITHLAVIRRAFISHKPLIGSEACVGGRVEMQFVVIDLIELNRKTSEAVVDVSVRRQ